VLVLWLVNPNHLTPNRRQYWILQNIMCKCAKCASSWLDDEPKGRCYFPCIFRFSQCRLFIVNRISLFLLLFAHKIFVCFVGYI